MKTSKVSSVCIGSGTDTRKLLSNAATSSNLVCIVTNDGGTEEQFKEVVSGLKELGKTVMADSLEAHIMYCTRMREEIKEPCLFRFAVTRAEDVPVFVSFFKGKLREFNRLFMLLRCEMNANVFMDACRESVDFTIIDKVALVGVPVCLSEGFRITAKDVLDVSEVITDRPTILDPTIFISQYRKSARFCTECSNRYRCFGLLKGAGYSYFRPSEGSSRYESIYDLVSEIACERKAEHGILSFRPRQAREYPIGMKVLRAMQDCRLKRNFDGENFFYVWDFEESCYFNRPMEEREIFTEDPRGLMGMNWQFIGKGIKELEWKQKCDLLLPNHGFNTTVKIKFDSTWTPDQQKALDDLTFSTIIRVVKEHGGEGHIEQIGNDLLYDGRKFAGKEWMFIQNVGYIENTVVTCEYEPEREWFEKLYHHPAEKKITGITDELPSVTKALLMREIANAVVSLVE